MPFPPPHSSRKPSRWREKAEAIRRQRAMHPLRGVSFLPASIQNYYHRFYSNRAGKLFATKQPSFSMRHASPIWVYEINPATGKENYLGEGILHYSKEKHAIEIHQVRKDQSLLRTTEERTHIRGTRGIQMFRAILDFAIESAKKNGLDRIVLRCNPKLAEYYKKFGFKIMENIYAHENTGAIVGYEMEFHVPEK